MSECLKSLIVNSIGVCVASPADKKQPPCIMVAYSVGNTVEDIRLFTMKLPKKRTCLREDFVNAISKLEKVRKVIYLDYNSQEKDIYVCRPKAGETCEIVQRDEKTNRFVEGFAEIESDLIKFDLKPLSVKIGKKLECEFFYRADVEYAKDSYEFAAVNAYNACLLGRVFSRDEFRLETGDGTKAKYEIRSVTSKYVDLTTLYLKSVKNSEKGVVEYYVTEPMLEINGEDMSQKTYQIIYKHILRDYSINRFD